MKIKKGGKIITLIGLCLFIFMLSSLLMMSKTLQNSELFDRFYLGLLLFNALGLVSLSILIILNLKRLIRQLKNRVIGSRMTVRIVILFSLLSVTPVLVVYYFWKKKKSCFAFGADNVEFGHFSSKASSNPSYRVNPSYRDYAVLTTSLKHSSKDE